MTPPERPKESVTSIDDVSVHFNSQAAMTHKLTTCNSTCDKP
jgi:hypothetical protein